MKTNVDQITQVLAMGVSIVGVIVFVLFQVLS